MDDCIETEAAAVAAIVKEHFVPETVKVSREQDGIAAELVLVPKGFTPHDVRQWLDPLLPSPRRKFGTSRHTVLDSLIAHVNRHKSEHSVVFVDDCLDNPSLTAIYNYHEPKDGKPHWCDHGAHYRFPLSEEWITWRDAANAGSMPQKQFAAFIQDNIVDVTADPGPNGAKFAEQIGSTLADPARLLEMARGLAVHVNAVVREHQVIASGETAFQFETQHKGTDGKPLRVPAGFMILIPVFRAGPKYRIPVRLMYRVDPNGVRWSIALHRADLSFRDALNDGAAKVAKDTGLPVFFGLPEGDGPTPDDG